MTGYLAIEYLPQLPGLLIGLITNSTSGTMWTDGLIFIAFYFGIYIIVAIILIKRSGRIADFLCDKTSLSSQIQIKLSRHDLLYVLFIGIGIYGIVQNTPNLLNSVFKELTNKIGNRGLNYDTYTRSPDYVLLILKVIIPALIIIFSKYLSEYFGNIIINVKEPIDNFGAK